MTPDDLRTVKLLLVAATCNSLDADTRRRWKSIRDEMVETIEQEVVDDAS